MHIHGRLEIQNEPSRRHVILSTQTDQTVEAEIYVLYINSEINTFIIYNILSL